MKGAYYYKKLGEGGVKCLLCPHNCTLKTEQYGICKSRQNIKGNLIATSYGNLCSVAIDPVEKKPLMKFRPGTLTYSVSSAGCNFSCLHCQNESISQYSPKERVEYNMTPERVVQNAIDSGCESISYTYTEPTTFYEFMIDTAKLAKERGIKNISVSNGYINEEPLVELCKYIDAFNIDLKYFSDALYHSVSGGDLETVLKSLKVIKENGCWIEITNLIIPDVNDDIDMIRSMCLWLEENGFEDYPLHLSRFYPRYKMSDKEWTPVDTMYKAKQVAEDWGIKNVYLGNV